MSVQAVLYAQSLERLSTFYADGVGLTAGETGDGYREMRADGLVLWLVRGQAPPPEVDAEGAVMRRSDVPLKLGFTVDNLDNAAISIEAVGGMIAGNTWKFAGYRRRDVVDPEGNVIQLLEPLAEYTI